MSLVLDDTQLGVPANAGDRPQRPSKARGWVPQFTVAGVFALFAALVSLVYWPGQVDPDSLDEWNEAATGHFANWHTPLLSALWRIPYVLGMTSPGWVLAASLFALVLGFYLVLRVRFGRSLSAAIAILCCCWPPVLSWAVHIGRDAWFAELSLCAFGFAARMVRLGRRQRRFNITAALVFAFLCGASWQIGIVALSALFVFLAFALLPGGVPHRRLAACGTALVACVALFGIQIGVEAALRTGATYPEQGTYIYDLGQLSRMEQKVLFPSQTLLSQRTALEYLNKIQIGADDGYVGSKAVVKFPMHGAGVTALRSAWVSSVLHHPWDYLKERTDLALAQLAISRPSFWTYQVPPDPPQLQPVSKTLRADGIDVLSAFSVSGNLYGDLLYAVWVYLALAAVAVPVLLKRARPGDSAIAALAVSTLLLEVAIFFTSPALVYRYGYPIVVVGTVLVPVMLPAFRAARDRHAARS